MAAMNTEQGVLYGRAGLRPVFPEVVSRKNRSERTEFCHGRIQCAVSGKISPAMVKAGWRS